MCSSALVETIECYMDDVVECFEDFVKKSLFVFTVGIGALVGVIVYLLKSLHERSSNAASLRAGASTGTGNIDGVEYNWEGYNKDGYNKDGYDRSGFTREGFNMEGYDRQGFTREGFDKSGFTREGYNREGRDRKGYTREGFDKSGFDRQGYDREGFNRLGYNREGFNREGYNREGFNRQGFNRDGLKKCPSQQCVRRVVSQQCVSRKVCPSSKIRPCVSRTLCAATTSSLSNTACSEEQLISQTVLSGCSKNNCPSNKRLMMGRICPATKVETGTCKGKKLTYLFRTEYLSSDEQSPR